jgi:GAF domain-containing protein
VFEEEVWEGSEGTVFHLEAVSLEEMMLGLVELAVELSAAQQAFFLPYENEEPATCAHIVKQGTRLALSEEQLGQLRERSGDNEISEFTLDESTIQILSVPIRLHSRRVGAICVQVQRSQKVVTRRLKELSDEAEQHMDTPRLLGEFRTVAQDLLSRRSRLPLSRRIVEQSREVLGADLAVLYEYLPERRQLHLPPTVSPGRGRKGERIQYERRIVKKLIDWGRPFYAANARSDWFEQGVIPPEWAEATLAFLAREEIESSAGIPLFAGNSKVGALFLNYHRHRTFSPAERIRLETLCSLAASAIRTVQLDEKAKKRTLELDVLDKTTREIGVRSDLDQRLREIVESAASLLGARGGKIYLKVPNRGQLRLSAAVGLGSEVYPIGTEIAFAQGMAGEVARTLTPKVVRDYGRYPGRLRDLEGVFEAVIEVPILLGGKLLGVLGVFDDRDRRYFTPRDIPLLSRLADNAALAIRDARDLELHQELARIDWANLTAETLYSRLVKEAASALDTSHCTVFLKRYIKGTGSVWCPCATSKSVVFRQFGLEEGLLGKVYRAGEAMNFANADQDPAFAEATKYQGTRHRSLAIAPIAVQGEIIGLISADQDRPNWFTDRDLLLLESLALHASIALSGIDRRRGESERRGARAARIREIRCGEASYPFREAVEVVETPTSFTVAGLEDTVVGHGQTAERAQRDFSRQFHEAFQLLRSLLPSFRDQQQQALWSILVRLVDIEALDRNRTIVVPNELGKVLSKQGTARRLKWHSGKVQDLDLDALPATFATLGEGSWFKAVVEQRYLTGEVTGVLHATAIARPKCHDLEARQRFWGQGA